MTCRSPEQRLCGLYTAALSVVAAAAIIGQVVIQRSLAGSGEEGSGAELAG